jgi:hypothetical protein
MAKISGEDQSLSSLRGALALVHGFVLLELKDQHPHGGDSIWPSRLPSKLSSRLAAYQQNLSQLNQIRISLFRISSLVCFRGIS